MNLKNIQIKLIKINQEKIKKIKEKINKMK